MQTALRNVAGAMLVVVSALRTGWPQTASQELSLSDVRAPNNHQSRSTPATRASRPGKAPTERLWSTSPFIQIRSSPTLKP